MFFGAGSSRARSDELNSASVPMRHQLDRCFEKAFVRARDAAAFDSIPLVNRDPSSGEGAACGVRLVPENDAGVVAAVTLVCVAMGEVVAEPGQHKIKLRRPDCNGFAQRNIESPADDEIEGVVGRVLVQPEMKKRRSPLVSIPPFGRGFSRHEVFRSDG